MGVAEINLLHETMQSIKITNTLKKTKKKKWRGRNNNNESKKYCLATGCTLSLSLGGKKKKKTPSSRKNSNVKLRQKAENASLYKTNSWWMAPTIFTRAKDIPVALFLSLPVFFFFLCCWSGLMPKSVGIKLQNLPASKVGHWTHSRRSTAIS